MNKEHMAKLVQRINRKDWWHVPPCDPQAYAKRGKFLSSTFRMAEYWGRPLDTPERITVQNPLVGDEETIERTLLGAPEPIDLNADNLADKQFAKDAKLYAAGRAHGYDAIVLLTPKAFVAFKIDGKLPISMELNLLVGEWQ